MNRNHKVLIAYLIACLDSLTAYLVDQKSAGPTAIQIVSEACLRHLSSALEYKPKHNGSIPCMAK